MVECGFDYSCSVQPEISPQLAASFAAAGLTRCALALDTDPATYNSALALNAAGIALDGYRELPLLKGADACAAGVANAVLAFSPLHAAGVFVRRLWLTAEEGSGDTAIEAFAAAVAAASPYDVGVYTGAWFWPGNMGDSQLYANLPLWHANYDGVAGLQLVSYGGWTKCAAKQYASPVEVAGINLDLDIFGD